MIDSVRSALLALRSQGAPAAEQLSVIALEDAPGALLGVDGLGHPHLLLEVPLAVGAIPDPGVATVGVSTRMLRISDRDARFLDVQCLFESVAEVFDHFVVGVVEKNLAGLDPVASVTNVLERWRQFLVPAKAPVGREKLAAVFGELLLLVDIGAIDASKAIASWVGPFGGRHDVRRGPVAIEVKTTRAHTSRQVTIHGEDQLDAPEGGTLHLHLVRIEEVPDTGRSVSSLADELLSEGVPADELFTALGAAGVPAAELSGTADVTFEVRERFTVPVDAETPRIVPDSFIGGARPVGVVDLSYVVDLDHSIDRALDGDGYANLLAELTA